MTLEHVALNLPDPQGAATWYAQNLGFRIVRSVEKAPYIHFLADDKGSMLEVYHNPAGAVPDYGATSPYPLHLAFSVADIEVERDRLTAAGATVEGEQETTPAGDKLLFMRDPWGVPLQLVSRATPLL